MEDKKNVAVSQDNGLLLQKNGLVLRKTGLRVLNVFETEQVGSGLAPSDNTDLTWGNCYTDGCSE